MILITTVQQIKMEPPNTAREGSSSSVVDLCDSPVNVEDMGEEMDHFLDSKSNPEAKVVDPEKFELQTNESITLCIPVEETSNTSTSSILSDAVVKCDRDCDDVYDSTMAICNLFNSSSDQINQSEESDSHSTKETSRQILITDLDSLSCDVKINPQKERHLNKDLDLNETSNQSDKKQEWSGKENKISGSMSPQIVLLDLQSQDGYVSDFLNMDVDKDKDEEDEFFSTDQLQPTEARFYFIDDSTRDHFDRDANGAFQNKNGGFSSPEFVREAEPELELQNSPIFLHDLNYDYSEMNSKTSHKMKNTETESDLLFYTSEGYSHYKSETSSLDGMCCSPKVSYANSNSDYSYSSQYYDFSVNDSGFFDASHVSSERNGSPLDYSLKMTNRNIGSTKSNLNQRYLDACSNEGATILPSTSQMSSHFVSPYENHSQTPLGPFCFANNSSMPSANPLLYKSSVPDNGMPFKQNLASYSDVSESCSLSGYPEWNTWSNGSGQEPSPVLPLSYVNPPFPQPKHTWHGQYSKMENAGAYHDYVKPMVNDNDSEETDDADEFDDVPIFFNSSNVFSGREQNWSLHQSSCHNEGTPMSQFGSVSPAPPSSASNTSSENITIYSPLPLPSKVSKTPAVKLESNFIPYEINATPKLPYPSMADMMRSSRSNASKSSSLAVKQILSNPISQGGRFRKNQIQSDAISTSTSKATRFKKKPWTPNPKRIKSDNVDDLFINLDSLEEDGQTQGVRRHNEPLKQSAIDIMTLWYEDHLDNPYPTKADKMKMANAGGVTVTQVKSWFANKRNRTNNTKPKVQKRVMEEKLKELFKDITCNRSIPLAENSHIIKQLSGIIQTCHSTKME